MRYGRNKLVQKKSGQTGSTYGIGNDVTQGIISPKPFYQRKDRVKITLQEKVIKSGYCLL
jgi:hypothetical protein